MYESDRDNQKNGPRGSYHRNGSVSVEEGTGSKVGAVSAIIYVVYLSHFVSGGACDV